MSVREKLEGILKSKASGPFLFLGSGFSRRYLGLENWKGMLERYCVSHPFEYYLALANGSYPMAARLIAEQFNEHWWTDEKYVEIREVSKSAITDGTSAMRIEISRYLSKLNEITAKQSGHDLELSELVQLNVDGVITTNWDLFAEQMFPGYEVYVGQDELLFSNPQQIGEIYKIHGCATKPKSLVLTDSDYNKFNERNPYLAAKLITIFVEHPVIFLGYSLSDPNINAILRSIASCIGTDKLDALRQNLIFVQPPAEGESESVADTFISYDGMQIPLTLAKTNDFLSIYQSINVVKRKIPARILRYCKEQLYDLVRSSEPEKKLCVVDYDEIDNKEDVEFLVGVGVMGRLEGVGDVGYAPIEISDLISDILHDDRKYDAEQILRHAIRHAGRNTKNVPVFKYLRQFGINSQDEYKEQDLMLDKWVNRSYDDFQVGSIRKSYYRYRHLSLVELIDSCTAETASGYIPHMKPDKIDLEVLHSFLSSNEDKMIMANSSYYSNFRKLVALYDKLRWGW
jgi:hypothetical protein